MTAPPLWAADSCRYPHRQFRYLFEPVERPVPRDAEIVTAYTDGQVTLRRNRRTEGYHEAATLDGFKGVARGDFVVHGLDILRGSIGVSDSDGAISAVCTICLPRPGVEPRFFAYVIRAQAWSGYVRAFARGVREGGADFRRWATLGDLRLPAPPLDTQRAVADFLDAETARIDALVEKQRRMIELLDQRRHNFVAEAVTVGLDRHAPLSDTGNPFAPQIPSGWQLVRLKHVVSRIVDTEHATAPVYEDGTHLVVRTANVKKGQLVLDPASYTNADGWKRWTQRAIPRAGDVMLTREAPAGEACIVPPDVPLCIGQRIVLLVVDRTKVAGEWLVHSLYSGPAQTFVSLLSRTTTVAHINMADIPNVPIVLPPLSVQSELLVEIDAEAKRLRTLGEIAVKQVALLLERRQALITAAVTGELDPGVAA